MCCPRRALVGSEVTYRGDRRQDGTAEIVVDLGRQAVGFCGGAGWAIGTGVIVVLAGHQPANRKQVAQCTARCGLENRVVRIAYPGRDAAVIADKVEGELVRWLPQVSDARTSRVVVIPRVLVVVVDRVRLAGVSDGQAQRGVGGDRRVEHRLMGIAVAAAWSA